MGPKLSCVHLHRVPIFRQLQIEEALFRSRTGNWCLFNEGSGPAVVMGLSGSLDEIRAGCPFSIIRRFSGGGTVIVDEGTLLCSFILDKDDLPCPSTPCDVMRWSLDLLRPAFLPHELTLEEQDYVLDGQKVGGNAQSFSKGRVVHHTSFLWSWQEDRMAFLSNPKRQPAYRAHREHSVFCNRLSNYFPSKSVFLKALVQAVASRFDCKEASEREVEEATHLPHRKTVSVVTAACR